MLGEITEGIERPDPGHRSREESHAGIVLAHLTDAKVLV